MTDTTTPPASATPKRGRGRPRIEVQRTPLYVLNGTNEEKLHGIYDEWYGCTKCFLGEHRAAERGPNDGDIVFGVGNHNADVVIVGEAPGAEEEATLVPFTGPAGKLLDQVLACVSDDPEIQDKFDWYSKAPRSIENDKEFHQKVQEWRAREFFITNAVCCRPPDNRTPVQLEVKACWERLWNTIYTIDPLLIIACGNTALAAVMRRVSISITAKRGELQEAEYEGHVGKLKYPVMPLFHPSYLLRVADWKSKTGTYATTIRDMRKAMEILDFLRLQHYGTPIPVRK